VIGLAYSCRIGIRSGKCEFLCCMVPCEAIPPQYGIIYDTIFAIDVMSGDLQVHLLLFLNYDSFDCFFSLFISPQRITSQPSVLHHLS